MLNLGVASTVRVIDGKFDSTYKNPYPALDWRRGPNVRPSARDRADWLATLVVRGHRARAGGPIPRKERAFMTKKKTASPEPEHSRRSCSSSLPIIRLHWLGMKVSAKGFSWSEISCKTRFLGPAGKKPDNKSWDGTCSLNAVVSLQMQQLLLIHKHGQLCPEVSMK